MREVDEVKARLDIVEVVRRYVDLRPVSGRWMGPCPFHQETKPSFSVNPDEGFYYCFGCQAAGDVIDFHMRVNGLDFREALEQLAAEVGVTLQSGQAPGASDESRKRRRRALEMHAAAQAFYRRCLSLAAGERARAYLKGRGLSPEVMEGFGLGVSPDSWDGLKKHLQSQGFSAEEALESGLLAKSDKAGRVYDRFRNRLMFPIQDLAGRIIAFGARLLEGEGPKYLNSSESEIYKKGEHLYGLSQARASMARTRRALLTEGYVDVISLHQFGYAESCGVLGTSLTSDQVRRLTGLARKVDLIFDGDEAGRKAALRSAEMILVQGAACRVVELPEGEDVDSVLQQHGRDGLEDSLAKAEDGLTFCFKRLQDTSSPKEIMEWAAGFLKRLTDESLQAYYIPRLADGLGLAATELRRTVFQASQGRSARDMVQEAKRVAQAPGDEDRTGNAFLAFAICYPQSVSAFREEGLDSLLQSSWRRSLWEAMLRGNEAEILHGLDEQAKTFWIRCRLEKAGGAENVDESVSEMCGILRKRIVEHRQSTMQEEMRRLQESGDRSSCRRLLQSFTETLGRDDGQC
ncbi:MAG: DNA primase [Desulfovibrionaceae bacterium]